MLFRHISLQRSRDDDILDAATQLYRKLVQRELLCTLQWKLTDSDIHDSLSLPDTETDTKEDLFARTVCTRVLDYPRAHALWSLFACLLQHLHRGAWQPPQRPEPQRRRNGTCAFHRESSSHRQPRRAKKTHRGRKRKTHCERRVPANILLPGPSCPPRSSAALSSQDADVSSQKKETKTPFCKRSRRAGRRAGLCLLLAPATNSRRPATKGNRPVCPRI